MSTEYKTEIVILRSDKDTHFTGGLAQDAMETESINFPSDWRTAGINSCIIEGISIQSDQNLDWDVVIFSGSEFDNTDLDLDKAIDYTSFANTVGKQVGGAGQYYYPLASSPFKIPYVDEDRSGKLHVGLVNRSATAKNAGATGEVVITFILRPVWG